VNEIESADAYCRLLATRHYENFAVASKIVPARIRLDLMRFYAFCRTTDDLGDESGSRAAALSRLARWRDETQAFFEGAAPVHPVLIALQETAAHYKLEKQPFIDLIAANEQDQRVHTYQTWPQLQAYCMLSAAPVGRVVLRFFGIANPVTEKLSDDVCIGLQLANHAQDVSRDAKIGRRYLLDEDLASGETRHAIEAMVRRARSLLASGKTLETMAPGALRLQLALYRLGGMAICDAIEHLGYATEVTRPSVSKRAKVGILVRAVMEAAHRRTEVRNAETA
jgi:squalene synthase HpnC